MSRFFKKCVIQDVCVLVLVFNSHSYQDFFSKSPSPSTIKAQSLIDSTQYIYLNTHTPNIHISSTYTYQNSPNQQYPKDEVVSHLKRLR